MAFRMLAGTSSLRGRCIVCVDSSVSVAKLIGGHGSGLVRATGNQLSQRSAVGLSPANCTHDHACTCVYVQLSPYTLRPDTSLASLSRLCLVPGIYIAGAMWARARLASSVPQSRASPTFPPRRRFPLRTFLSSPLIPRHPL